MQVFPSNIQYGNRSDKRAAAGKCCGQKALRPESSGAAL